MSMRFPIGEQVIWLSGLESEYDLQMDISPVEAEIVRVEHGRVLIRTWGPRVGMRPQQFVERWVHPATLRRRPA